MLINGDKCNNKFSVNTDVITRIDMSKFKAIEVIKNYCTNSGYYSETVMQPPVFFLPGWLADIVEENNEHVFTERR